MLDLETCSKWLTITIASALKTPPSKVEMKDLSYAIGMKWPSLKTIALCINTDEIVDATPTDTKKILVEYNVKLREAAIRVYRQRRHIY